VSWADTEDVFWSGPLCTPRTARFVNRFGALSLADKDPAERPLSSLPAFKVVKPCYSLRKLPRYLLPSDLLPSPQRKRLMPSSSGFSSPSPSPSSSSYSSSTSPGARKPLTRSVRRRGTIQPKRPATRVQRPQVLTTRVTRR